MTPPDLRPPTVDRVSYTMTCCIAEQILAERPVTAEYAMAVAARYLVEYLHGRN